MVGLQTQQGGSFLVVLDEDWGVFPARESFTFFVTWNPLGSLVKPMDRIMILNT